MADRRYVLEIVINGRNNASAAVTGFSNSLSHMGRVISGILIAGGIYKLGGAIRGLGSEAFDSVADIQRLQIGLENLIASELARGTTATRTSTVVKQLSDMELGRLDSLQDQMELLNAKKEYYLDLQARSAEKYGEESFQALRAKQNAIEAASEWTSVRQEFDALAGMQGKLITITEQYQENVGTVAENLQAAQEPARLLTRWIENLAVTTPFDEEQVANAFRASAAYGFAITKYSDLLTVEEQINAARADGVVTSQRATRALIDLIAGIGLPNEYLDRIAFAMGQVQAKGKLAAEEIRQFVNAGIGINLMADAMGMTVSEFKTLQEQGSVAADVFLPALTKYIEDNFGGAADRMLETIGGLVGALGQMKRVLLRDFAEPIAQVLQPRLKSLLETVSSDEFRDKVSEWGTRAAEGLDTFLTRLDKGWKLYQLWKEGIVDLNKVDFKYFFGEDLGGRMEDVRTFLNDIDTKLKEWGIVGGAKEVSKDSGKLAQLILGGLTLAKFGPAMMAVGRLGLKIGLLTGGISALYMAWKTDWGGIATETKEAWEDDIKPPLDSFIETLEQKFPTAIPLFLDTASKFLQWLEDTAREGTFAGQAIDSIGKAIGDAIETMNTGVQKVPEQPDADWSTILPDLEGRDAILAAREQGGVFWPAFWATLAENAGEYDEANQKAEEAFKKMFRSDTFRRIGKALGSALLPIFNEEIWAGINFTFPTFTEKVDTGIRKAFSDAIAQATENKEDFRALVIDPLFDPSLWTPREDNMTLLIPAMYQKLRDNLFIPLGESIKNDQFFDAEFWGPLWKKLFPEQTFWDENLTILSENLDGSLGEWAQFTLDLETALGELPNIWQGFKNSMQGIVDGVVEIFASAYTAIANQINAQIWIFNYYIEQLERVLRIFSDVTLPRIPELPGGSGGVSGGRKRDNAGPDDPYFSNVYNDNSTTVVYTQSSATTKAVTAMAYKERFNRLNGMVAS